MEILKVITAPEFACVILPEKIPRQEVISFTITRVAAAYFSQETEERVRGKKMGATGTKFSVVITVLHWQFYVL